MMIVPNMETNIDATKKKQRQKRRNGIRRYHALSFLPFLHELEEEQVVADEDGDVPLGKGEMENGKQEDKERRVLLCCWRGWMRMHVTDDEKCTIDTATLDNKNSDEGNNNKDESDDNDDNDISEEERLQMKTKRKRRDGASGERMTKKRKTKKMNSMMTDNLKFVGSPTGATPGGVAAILVFGTDEIDMQNADIQIHDKQTGTTNGTAAHLDTNLRQQLLKKECPPDVFTATLRVYVYLPSSKSTSEPHLDSNVEVELDGTTYSMNMAEAGRVLSCYDEEATTVEQLIFASRFISGYADSPRSTPTSQLYGHTDFSEFNRAEGPDRKESRVPFVSILFRECGMTFFPSDTTTTTTTAAVRCGHEEARKDTSNAEASSSRIILGPKAVQYYHSISENIESSTRQVEQFMTVLNQNPRCELDFQMIGLACTKAMHEGQSQNCERDDGLGSRPHDFTREQRNSAMELADSLNAGHSYDHIVRAYENVIRHLHEK